MVMSLFKRFLRPSDAKSSLMLQQKVDHLQRVRGYGILQPDGPSCCPVAHVKDAPLTRKTFYIKQINSGQLTDLGRAALLTAFTGYADGPEIKSDRDDYAAAMSRRLGCRFVIDPRTQRRYSGDHTLPRGRYYALCDETGNDGGTLVSELRSYYTPAVAGVVRMYDCTLPGDLKLVRAREVPAGSSGQLMFSFPPVSELSNPFAGGFASLVSNQISAEFLRRTDLLIGLPLSISQVTRERVLDLREPDSAEWFTQVLTALEWTLPKGAIPCFPDRPHLTRFRQLLPELLTQENGGGGVTVAAGVMLRHLGADGLVFPSARSDARTLPNLEHASGPIGWNFVDFAGAGPPEFLAWIEHGKAWPDQVGFRPYADALADAEPVWYPEVCIVEEEAGWRVDGLRNRTDLGWRKRLLSYVLNCHRKHLTEHTWGTLITLPELLADHGQVHQAGLVAMLVLDAAMGSEPAAEQLSAMFPKDAGIPDLNRSVDELLVNVHLPARELSARQQVIYVPWQGADSGES
jgi:hypothetical protein